MGLSYMFNTYEMMCYFKLMFCLKGIIIIIAIAIYVYMYVYDLLQSPYHSAIAMSPKYQSNSARVLNVFSFDLINLQTYLKLI